MQPSVWGKTIATFGTIVLSCMLVFSFGLHTVQVKHVHPTGHVHGEASEDADLVALNEYLHGTEKKLFFYTVLSFLIFGAFVCFFHSSAIVVLAVKEVVRIRRRMAVTLRCFNYLCSILSEGILNPKPYSFFLNVLEVNNKVKKIKYGFTYFSTFQGSGSVYLVCIPSLWSSGIGTR